MSYQLSFKNLPFEPVDNQVIYVEGTYNEPINNILRQNYDLLRTLFDGRGFEFIYLPMLFKDEVMERKVRYYAPFLERKIMENIELRSSYLLDFISLPDGAGGVKPSLLFAPERHGDEWMFQACELQPTGDNLGDLYRLLDDVCRGNLFLNECCEPKASVLKNYQPTSECIEQKRKRKRSIFFRMVDKIQGELFDDDCNCSPQPPRDEVAEILENLQENVRRLRLQGVALEAIHEFIDKQETISHILITDDLRIFLPLYNNLEIVMPAQRKALYFLFLNHPEGIVLQHLEEYHKELMNYYRQTNGGVVTPRMEESIKRLETYGNNQLNVVITRIREAFCSKFDERLARHYLIAGERGQAYKIALDRNLVVWQESAE